MSMRYLAGFLLNVIVLVGSYSIANAQADVPIVKVLEGVRGQIKKDSVLSVTDSLYFDPSYNSRLVKPYPVKNLVTLKIRQDQDMLFPTSFTAAVTLKVVYYVDAVNAWQDQVTLTVNYDSTAASLYSNISSYVFTGGYRTDVTIIKVDTGSVSWPVTQALVLENEIQPNHNFNFSCSNDAIQSVSFTTPAGGDELTVTWPSRVGVDQYDLEWAYIDSSALADGLYNRSGSISPDLVFGNNASRVAISGNIYNIPLFYGNKGSLFFRVRSAQTPVNGIRRESNWSTDYLPAGLGRYDYNGHEPTLNWQATTSFAEEGKRKSVLKYYDGSLRERQAVTKDNSTKTTIVGETFYDQQGRAVIQVLPTPTLNTVIGYSKNFNIGMNGIAYDKEHYDQLLDPSVYCNAGAEAMKSDSGASRYYSPNNPDKTGMNRFIPDATGYPFTEVEYTQDNTGRVNRQGGVGPQHKLGSGHETRYYYGTPTQEELDGLFGTEVGYANHYFKTMTKDANGQMSVSYADMRGRTIATALAGIPDGARLDTLDSNIPTTITEKLTDSLSNVTKDLTMESMKTLLVAVDGNYVFNYRLDPASLQLADCNNVPVCYDCLYDLDISISDDCNNQTFGGTPFDTVLHNFSLAAIDTTCNNVAGNFNFSFTKWLGKGSYVVTKKLSLNKDALAFYRDSVFAARNTCRTINDFINDQRQLLAVNKNCVPSCDSCKKALGTLSSFSTKFKTAAGIKDSDTSYNLQIQAAYNQAIDDCSLLCSNTTEQTDIRKAMLLDLTPPSGQYANLAGETSDTYSIFHSTYNDTVLVVPAAYSIVTNYRDGEGKLDSVIDDHTGKLVPPQMLDQEQFAQKFKLSWAESLLSYHPEYCKLIKYQTFAGSQAWDKRFEQTDTYAEALAKGYLNPLGLTGSYARFNGTPGLIDRDSLAIMNGSYYLARLTDSLTGYKKYKTTTGGPDIKMGIWSLATITVKCTDNSLTCFNQYLSVDNSFSVGDCDGDLDMQWRAFRQMYLDIKRKVINKELIAYNTNASCPARFHASTVDIVNATHQPHFTDADELYNAPGVDLPKDVSSASQVQQQVADQTNAFYDANCKAYVQQWWRQLAPCNYTSTDSAALIPILINICKEGSDVDHQSGSSSVKPSSSYSPRSFEEAINNYNVAHGIVATYCNAYLITAPQPYDKQNPYSDKPLYSKPSSCECDLINKYNLEYKLKRKLTDVSLSYYLLRTKGIKISQTDISTLLSMCNASSNCRYLSNPIILPVGLQCNIAAPCVECTLFDTLYNQFTRTFPGIIPTKIETDTVQQKKNQLFANYMNYRLGFAKQAWEYLNFKDSCTHYSNDTVCVSSNISKIYNSGGTDFINHIITTSDSGFVMAGRVSGVGHGGTDACVIRTDRRGNVKWAKAFGGSRDDVFVKINQTSDKGFIAIGNTKSLNTDQSQVFIVKMDSLGNQTWAKALGGQTTHGDKGTDIIQTTDSNYAYVGVYDDYSGVNDFIVGAISKNGSLLWTKQIGYRSSDGGGTILQDGDSLVVYGLTVANTVSYPAGGEPANSTQTNSLVQSLQTVPLDTASIQSQQISLAMMAYGLAAPTLVPHPGSFHDRIIFKMSGNNGTVFDVTTYSDGSSNNEVGTFHKYGNGYRVNGYDRTDYSSPIQSVVFDIDKDGNVLKSTLLSKTPNGYSSTHNAIPCIGGGTILVQADPASPMDIYGIKLDDNGSITHTNKIKFAGDQLPFPITQSYDGRSVFSGASDNHAMLISVDTAMKTGCYDTAANFTRSSVAVTKRKGNLPTTNESLNISDSTFSFAPISLAVTATDYSCFENDSCFKVYTGPYLCGNSEPVFPSMNIQDINNCSDSTFFITSRSTELYKVYIDSLNNVFDSTYHQKCMQAYKYETFTVSHTKSEYHYTLYYYDQAGNLIKTVPPKGVVTNFAKTYLDAVASARAAGTPLVVAHSLVTQYRYNTLNQVVAQITPDAGQSAFWYDRLGRLVVSQNAKQKAASTTENNRLYSYTQYDVLGRITEVGQIANATTSAMTNSVSRNASSLDTWLLNSVGNKSQITTTVYDIAYAGYSGFGTSDQVVQRNLRNRVAYTSYTDGANTAQFNQATMYTYDIMGNVDTLLQDYGSSTYVATTRNVMNANGSRFKKIVYTFDLISGKVNTVSYQAGKTDELYHKYEYDAENRITNVKTSTNGSIWQNDARYNYYKHGPLARTVLGDQIVQGLDYAYTLQGWLKGVNSISLAGGNTDMGEDSKTGSINKYVAKDVIGFNLNYFSGDYSPIESTVSPFPGHSAYMASADYRPLYNGNISSMAVNIGVFNQPQLYNYRYDQLNRLTGMDVFRGLNQTTNSWTAIAPTTAFGEKIKYDPNGNISSYQRNAEDGYMFDNMTYNYDNGTNRLNHISDAANQYTKDYDIDDQVNNNYKYDEIGNLIQDNSADNNLTSIKWNVYGKITEINRVPTGNATSQIKFTYDAAGNRISKTVVDGPNTIYYWYVRDAQGNLMSMYQAKGNETDLSNLSLNLWEQYVYGSSRLGYINRQIPIENVYYSSTGIKYWTTGQKQFELSNHLGNVLATIQDKKRPVAQTGSPSLFDHYETAVINAQDYYPFGMLMPTKQYHVTATPLGGYYRYGFNGKEKDNEISGEGNQYDYGFRIYNPRIGRFLSVDPLTQTYPWYTPYQFAGNMPIWAIDLDGLEEMKANSVANVIKDASGNVITKPTVVNDPSSSADRIPGVRRLSPTQVEVTPGLIENPHPYWNTFTWQQVNGKDFYVNQSITPIGQDAGGGIKPPKTNLQQDNEDDHRPTGTTTVISPINNHQVQNQTLTRNINFTPAQPSFASPADAATVNQVAASAPNSTTTGRPVTTTRGSTTTTTTTTTQVRSIITVDLSTNNAPTTNTISGLNGKQLQEARYRLIRGQLISQGVPARNIRMGTINYNVPTSQMNGNVNQIDFRIQTTRTRTQTGTSTTTTD